MHIKKWILFIALALSQGNALATEEPPYCGFYPKLGYKELPATVKAQRAATSPVPIEKVLAGDLIFFRGSRWKCPHGVSGLVTYTSKEFIVFVIGVGEPKEQVLVFPRGKFKGSAWYQLGAEIRTYQPETDPPRPGDKGYVPDR